MTVHQFEIKAKTNYLFLQENHKASYMCIMRAALVLKSHLLHITGQERKHAGESWGNEKLRADLNTKCWHMANFHCIVLHSKKKIYIYQ